jgi:hypothetical protein
VRALVAGMVTDTKAKISAKRLLPVAAAEGYVGSARNFRRLVAQEKTRWRQTQAASRGRRPAVWTAAEHLVIDWGVQDGQHVFCAVLAFLPVRFRAVRRQRARRHHAGAAGRVLRDHLGGVPKVVLADRMGCLKGGVVADVVVPTPDYDSAEPDRPGVGVRRPAARRIEQSLVCVAASRALPPST